jgi:hypothetical protein
LAVIHNRRKNYEAGNDRAINKRSQRATENIHGLKTNGKKITHKSQMDSPITNDMDPGNLSNLRDIIEPATIPWWPLAPGMVLIIVLIMLWTAVAMLLWWRHWRRNAYRRQALADMAAIATKIRSPQTRPTGLQQLSVLLKRVALAAFPRAEVAALAGAEWAKFLDGQIGDDFFRSGPGRVLAAASSDPDVGAELTPSDCDRLIQTARRWITAHRPAARTADSAEAGA